MAIADAQATLHENVAALGLDRCEAELTSWKKG